MSIALPRFIIRDRAATLIDWGVVLLSFLSGVLFPAPEVYYTALLQVFLIVTVPLLLFSYLIYRFSEQNGLRIQGVRKAMPPIAREVFGTVRAMFIVACLAAWPVGLYRLGVPTGIAWTLEQMGLTWWMAVLEMYVGIVAIDAITYWKHRLLHTRAFFAFHKHHHSFRDPTPFAGFAVGPVETILTFWPLLLICIPEAKHFAPLYFTAIVGFVFLNLYLHCGVTFDWLEKVLPRLNLNTSAWHNVHHSHTNMNFGEVSAFWDRLCKTTRAHYQLKKKAAAQ